MLLISTINRTLKAYLLAIVGAEYVLRWLPVGTHQWERFVTPQELQRYLQAAGCGAPTFKGLVYSPLADAWSLADDTDVNYFAAAAKAGDRPAFTDPASQPRQSLRVLVSWQRGTS